MYQTIRDLFESSDYDFRTFAFPGDPLQHLFEQWVPYYRMKWAIVRALQPARILEIGVRYGYSTRTFLDASPGAEYLGIDLDAESYGGTPGAIEWARKIAEGRKANFLLGNTQKMKQFPGGMYDLIHVDGQQDRDGFFRDGQKALRQSRYVLVDGYFWSDETFEASNALLRQYKSMIEFSLVIPGYAGDLLIKTQDAARCAFSRRINPAATSQTLQESYTSDYYLHDCGGYDAFRRTGGKTLEDPRLAVLAALAQLRPNGKFLDLGCGRGELAYAFAAQGACGVAIDYSPDAIRIVEQCFEGEPELRRRVQLICGDATTCCMPENVEVATAGDLVEHLTPAELNVLYTRVSRTLAPDGLFIVHTFPNLWFYKYGYPRRRKAAMAGGKYISPEPRSHYEELMHINEQSPRVLRDELRRQFKHVLVWIGTPGDPVGSLAERKPISYFHATSDIFAVASNSPIDVREIKAKLSRHSMPAIPVPNKGSVGIDIIALCSSVPAGQTFSMHVVFSNRTPHRLGSLPPHPVCLTYHWVDAANGKMVVFEGQRTRLANPLAPGEKATVEMQIVAPTRSGRYRLQLTVVQESVAWWDGIVQPTAEILIT